MVPQLPELIIGTFRFKYGLRLACNDYHFARVMSNMDVDSQKKKRACHGDYLSPVKLYGTSVTPELIIGTRYLKYGLRLAR